MYNKYLQALDTFNEVDLNWDELKRRSFIAKYPGTDANGQDIKPGDRITKLVTGGYILIAN